MKLISLLILSALGNVAHAQNPMHATFALDQSSSNPNEVQEFRNAAARYAKDTVTALKMGDTVAVMTFGDGNLPCRYSKLRAGCSRHGGISGRRKLRSGEKRLRMKYASWTAKSNS